MASTSTSIEEIDGAIVSLVAFKKLVTSMADQIATCEGVKASDDKTIAELNGRIKRLEQTIANSEPMTDRIKCMWKHGEIALYKYADGSYLLYANEASDDVATPLFHQLHFINILHISCGTNKYGPCITISGENNGTIGRIMIKTSDGPIVKDLLTPLMVEVPSVITLIDNICKDDKDALIFSDESYTRTFIDDLASDSEASDLLRYKITKQIPTGPSERYLREIIVDVLEHAVSIAKGDVDQFALSYARSIRETLINDAIEMFTSNPYRYI